MDPHRQVLETILSVQATPPPAYPSPTIVTINVEGTRDPLAPWFVLQSWNVVRRVLLLLLLLRRSLSRATVVTDDDDDGGGGDSVDADRRSCARDLGAQAHVLDEQSRVLVLH